jgi:hypothetical protein
MLGDHFSNNDLPQSGAIAEQGVRERFEEGRNRCRTPYMERFSDVAVESRFGCRTPI